MSAQSSIPDQSGGGSWQCPLVTHQASLGQQESFAFVATVFAVSAYKCRDTSSSMSNVSLLQGHCMLAEASGVGLKCLKRRALLPRSKFMGLEWHAGTQLTLSLKSCGGRRENKSSALHIPCITWRCSAVSCNSERGSYGPFVQRL